MKPIKHVCQLLAHDPHYACRSAALNARGLGTGAHAASMTCQVFQSGNRPSAAAAAAKHNANISSSKRHA